MSTGTSGDILPEMMNRQDMTLQLVAQILGHSSTKTGRIYAHVPRQELIDLSTWCRGSV
jgi:site-specific recombinase XerD